MKSASYMERLSGGLIMKKLRLCYFLFPKSNHNQRWMRAFVKLGHEVHCISYWDDFEEVPGVIYHRTPPEPDIPPKALKWLHMEAYLRPSLAPFRAILKEERKKYPDDLPMQLRHAIVFRRLLRRIHPHVLHAHFIVPFGWWAALSAWHPCVMSAWGGDVLEDQGAFLQEDQRIFTAPSLRGADLVTCDCNLVAQTLEHLGVSPDRIVQVQWGADLEVFRPGLPVEQWRRRLEIGAGPVVLSPRHLDPLYNIETLVEAIPGVLHEVPETTFILKDYMGVPSYVDTLKARVKELGIEGNVRFLGEIPYEQMAGLFNLAQVAVSVPLSDGMPVTLFEAMACGAVPVVSNLPAPTQMVRQGENGMVVEMRDSTDLAQAIVKLLRDDALRERMKNRNLALVREHGDHNAQMRKMERLYYQLARRQP